MAFLTWETRFSTSSPGVAGWSTLAQVYGSAITEGTRAFAWGAVFGREMDGSECYIGMTTARQLVLPNQHVTYSDASGGNCTGEATLSPGSVDDVWMLGFFPAQGGFVGCQNGSFGEPSTCVSVPEPNTWPMVLTAMLGLGIVVWRRRERDSLT